MNQALTNIPSIRNNHPTFWHDLNNGTYLKLAPRIAVHRDHYHGLSLSAQLHLRAIAAARSAYTAVLISKSAARLHGLWVLASAEEKVEMALPHNSLPNKDRRHPERIYRKTKLPDPLLVHGARTVSPARAVIDIARFHGFREGLIAADSALRAGITKKALRQEFARMGRVRNSAVVREVIHHSCAASPSPYASFARALLIQADFPWPMFFEIQYATLPGITAELCINKTYVIDIETPGGSYTVGATTTTAGPLDDAAATAMPTMRDKAGQSRDKRLRDAGFTVIQCSPQQLVQHPERFISEVTATISARQNAIRSQQSHN
ncbi:hypothetical protein QP970_02795 [Corynebacterium sp. MSK073]|uniref:hypothetical protein n=1 Tax=Corynebacterium sp. MSK073 TaxID=3050198 RepID=UPI00254E390A|nr:hypothetical protein [Corynebacterium sp. MSK073]MDK8814300.1 hypothetical protein [Corynebacterium sp. MSK073]